MKVPFIFVPAAAVMNRLRFSFKVALVAVVALSLTTLLAGIIVTDRISEIKTLHSEEAGALYVADDVKLISLLQQHRGLSTSLLKGASNLSSKVQETQQQIDQLFAKLEEQAKQSSQYFSAGEDLAKQRSAWSSIRSGLANSQADANFANHTALIEQKIAYVRAVADASGMSYDPYPDSYLLQELLVNYLPWSGEYAGRLRGQAASLAAAKQASPEQLQRLAVTTGTLTFAYDKVTAAISRIHPHLRAGDYELINSQMVEQKAALTAVNQTIVDDIYSQRFQTDSGRMFSLASAPVAANQKLSDKVRDVLATSLSGHIRDVRTSLVVTLVATFVALGLMAYLMSGWYFSVLVAVRQAVDGGHRMADGDLTARVEIDSRDEMRDIGDSFNRMADSLRVMVASIKHGTGQIARVSGELASTAAHISHSTDMQSESASSMAASIEEMSASIQTVADSAAEVDQLSAASLAGAHQGTQSTTAMMAEIGRVGEVVSEIAKTTTQFVNCTREISSMTKQVRDIAEQTNLLALNAAIEAARAGEAGRGFAVVADEVRKLAEKSAAAASEIDNITHDLTKRSESVDEVVSRGTEAIQQSLSCVDNVVNVLQGAHRSVESSRAGMSDITCSVSEQNVAAQELAGQVESIAHAAEENSISIRDLASRTGALKALAEELEGPVGKFRV